MIYFIAWTCGKYSLEEYILKLFLLLKISLIKMRNTAFLKWKLLKPSFIYLKIFT